MELAFPAPAEKTYELRAVFTKAADYGIMQLHANKAKLGDPMDFYHDGVVATKELSLGQVQLKKGLNSLKIEVKGSNPLCDPPRRMFGLDYLRLVPVR